MRRLSLFQVSLLLYVFLLTIHPGALSAQVTPIITWADPADIVAGTPLGPAQQNATASVPGTFSYGPKAGTVLDGGNGQFLFVTFQPTDSVNYTGAEKSVHINVLEGRISGKITVPVVSSVLGSVSVYSASGNLVSSAGALSDHTYSVGNMADGAYFVKVTGGSQFVDQLYDGILCISVCNVTLGMPVAVSVGSTTPNIDFTLVEKGRISGTVISTAGVPVQFMTVEVYKSTGAIFASTTTNADGTYTISGLPADTYFVKTATESLYPNQLFGGLACPSSCDVTIGAPVSVTLGATTPNINFALVQRGRISGKVTNTVGAPLASVTVNLFTASGNQVKTASTDANGIYTVTDLDPGTYFARVGPFTTGLIGQLYSGAACAYSCTVTTGTPIKVTAGATTPNINFALDVDGRISGKATYTNGTPVISAQVFIHDASGVSVRSALTDTGGNYTITGLSAGTYFASAINFVFSGSNPVVVFLAVEEHYNGITCQGCDITQATPIPVTSGATTPNINFTLKDGGTISGKVTLAAGFSPSLMTVQAQNSFGRVFTGVVQTNGTYSITGLAADNYFVRTINGSLNGHIDQLYKTIPLGGGCLSAGAPQSVSVAAGVTTPNINFTLATGGRISGKITDTNGAPLSNMAVQFYNVFGCLVSTSFDSSSDGTFNSQGLLGGTYFAQVASGGGVLGQLYSGVPCEISCTVTSGTPITVTLGATTPNINFTVSKAGNFSGGVIDEGGKPASDISIEVYDSSGNFVQSVKSSNSFGTYTVFNLRPGTYFARTASNAVYVPQLYNRTACGSGCNVTSGKPITVTAGATTSNISFVLTEGSRISGSVNLPGRADMSGATVEVYNASGFLVATANTNAGGLYTVTGLPAGSYYARTRNNLGYIDQLYGRGSCVSCTVTAGAAIAVAFATTNPNINFTLAPALNQITPPRGGRGANISVALTGTNFSSGMTIDAGVGITVSGVAVLSPTLATAKFSIASTAALGGQSVMVTLTGATSNAVTFTVDPPVLSVSRTGSGSGTVISSPPGIDCGVTCTTPFTIGQVFTLTGTPDAGSVFAGWGGDADCSDGSVTMTDARNCTARFDLPQVNSTLLRGDYDGDGKTDIAVYRPSTGEWFLRLSTQNYVVATGNWYFQWGMPGDVPISGDFDGDGKTDISVYRPSTGEWYLRLSTQGYAIAAGNWYFQWGVPGDVPITGDFDGDGKTDIAVYRPSTGEWFLRLSTRDYAVAQGNWYFQWGTPGDQPIAGDFDGDGRTDIAAYRSSTGEWFIRLSTQSYAIASGNWYYQWGVSGDQPVAGDYDGDHKTDIAVYRPSTGEWYLRLSTLNYAIASGNWYFQWGIPGDLSVKADFDGDSKADIAVYRPSSGEWYLRLSTLGYTVAQGNWYFQWGVPGDLPIRR